MKDNHSFSIHVPSSSSLRQSAIRNDSAKPEKPLSIIIAETSIREKNFQYQQMLINSKELEIQLNQCKNQHNSYLKRRRKAEKTYEDAQAKVNQAKLEYKQKKHFLDKYYDALDKRFRGGKEELFSSLATLEQNLLQAYEKDERRLKDSLKIEEQQFTKVQEFIVLQRLKRDNLKMQLMRLQTESNNQSFGMNKNVFNELQELKNENKHYREEIQKLNKQKKKVQTEQKVLKKIQNIQEQHKRHTTVILNGIKKIFIIRLKEQNYKEAVLPEYIKNISGLKQILNKRKHNKETLLHEIAQKREKLQKIMKDVNDKHRQYGQLQDVYLKQQQ